MNIGILGTGSFGQKHINTIRSIKEFNIIGFFDPNKKTAKEVEDKFDIKAYKNPIALIQKCDAIDIVSATHTHYELLKLCINNHKHIFIEKPICSNVKEIKDILHMTQKYPQVIQVGHIERYNPAYKELTYGENIQSITTLRTGTLNERNKNTLITLDLMIHDIDLITNMIKSPIKEIKAVGKNFHRGLYHHVQAQFIFENGKYANLTCERNSNIKNKRIMSIQEKNKILEIDLLNKTHTTINNSNNRFETVFPTTTNLIKEELIDFMNSIKKGMKIKTNVQEGCYAANIALKIESIIQS